MAHGCAERGPLLAPERAIFVARRDEALVGASRADGDRWRSPVPLDDDDRLVASGDALYVVGVREAGLELSVLEAATGALRASARARLRAVPSYVAGVTVGAAGVDVVVTSLEARATLVRFAD